MTEEGKRLVEQGPQALRKSLDQGREPRERRFHQPGPPARKLHRAHLDIRR
jgi:hypothetical protein